MEGKRVAAGGAGLPGRARAMDFHDVDDLIPMHHHEEAPEMGKVTICVEIKIACCIVASTSTPST